MSLLFLCYFSLILLILAGNEEINKSLNEFEITARSD